MQLDVIVATYNRKELLQRAIESILGLVPPPGIEVRVIVADNNSKDGTAEVVRSLALLKGDRLRYILEPRQGKSYALNTAIAVSDGTLIGIVDDDEELHPDWLNRVVELFRNPEVQYAGGRTLPTPGVVLPGWVPTCDFRAVLGWTEGPQQSCPYTPDNPAVFLMGGNAIFRAEFLRNLGDGPYNVSVGRKGRGLLTADDDMYGRVLATGAVGIYDPGLIVYHAVQPYMLTKNYYRRWCFWAAVSGGALGRKQPANVPYLLGVPRWMLRRGIESFGRFLVRRFSPDRKRRDSSFLDELYAIETAGALYGRYLFEPATSD